MSSTGSTRSTRAHAEAEAPSPKQPVHSPPQEQSTHGLRTRSKRAIAPSDESENASPPEKWRIPVRQARNNKGNAASVNAISKGSRKSANDAVDGTGRKNFHDGLIDATIIDTDTSAGGSRKSTRRKNLPVGEVSYSADTVVATGKGGEGSP